MDAQQENSRAEQALYMVSLLYRQREGGSLSVSEQEELNRWLEEPGNRQLAGELADRRQTVAGLRKLEAYDSDVAVNNIFERLSLPLPVLKNRAGMMGRRMAVAAALVLAVAAVWLFERRMTAPVVVVPAPKLEDIKPGGNMAVLTLGNGSRIVLDSSGSGTIARQGGVSIIKQADGRVSYRPVGAGHADSVVYNTLSTPRGGVYQLTLPDGSRAWLNAASSITYPTVFTGSERLVRITGEVYFEVAHHPRQPFKVQAGNQLVEDIATAFDINAYSDEPAVVTTLTEGKAKVMLGPVVGILSPGQQARTSVSGLVVAGDADTAQALAWKNGSFSFRHADLPSVMRQLSRWYAIDVVYEGAVPTGTFDGEIGRGLTLNQVLQGLAQTRIHYVIENSHKIIIRP